MLMPALVMTQTQVSPWSSVGLKLSHSSHLPMSLSSDLSPRAKLNYDSDKFLVEFNVSEYAPEVRYQAVMQSIMMSSSGSEHQN